MLEKEGGTEDGERMAKGKGGKEAEAEEEEEEDEVDKEVVTDGRLKRLLEEKTTVELRAAMNGGLARQLFRKARIHLDAGLTLQSSPDEMCTLNMNHLAAAVMDITPLI